MTAERHEFTVDLSGLITLLARNLYTESDVFVRELIQNAHDSIVRRSIDQDEPVYSGRIDIRVDVQTGTIAFEDNGCGLTKDEITNYIARIGQSGTKEIRTAFATSNRQAAESLIGQFGIGLLSAFIVAEEIRMDTRSATEAPMSWVSDGGPEYTIDSSVRDMRGTTVTLKLRPSQMAFLNEEALRLVIRRYAEYIGIPIHLNGSNQPINAVDAPWHRWKDGTEPDRDECYLFWERRFVSEKSLHIFVVDERYIYTDHGEERPGRVRGILGITDRHVPDFNARGIVDLFVRRTFIGSGLRNILPSWAKFIQGVLESNDLEPNAARDNVMHDARLLALQQCLHNVIIRELRAQSALNPLRFKEIMHWHAYHVLGMAVLREHLEFFREIADLVPLPSDAGLLTVPEYLQHASRRTDGSAVVYYLIEREPSNQYYMLCQARGIRVFDCSENFAEAFLMRYAEVWPEQIRLSRIDDLGTGVIFDELDEPTRNKFAYLEDAFKRIVNTRTVDIRTSRFAPIEVPAIFTSGKQTNTATEADRFAKDPAMPDHIRRTLAELVKELGQRAVLHINSDSPVMQRLADQGPTVSVANHDALVAIMNNATLLTARELNGQDIERMFSQYSLLIERFVDLSEQNLALERAIAARETELIESRADSDTKGMTRYVQCFVAMPFQTTWATRVFDCLRAVLENRPYCWRVLRADDRVGEDLLWSNIKKLMIESHCFVSLIGDGNPNVLIETGRMEAIGRPVLLIKDRAGKIPTDLEGRLYIEVDSDSPNLQQALEEQVRKQDIIGDQLGEPYLSDVVLAEIGVGGRPATQLRDRFETWTAVLSADPLEAATQSGVDVSLIRFVQERLAQMS